ncbi:hypothetical protein HPB50_005584 [Hyalomma asiaticum]|uniref:Uncharacterized protein n=1 Tax=Hyalomma asiaticum TaxID=266040 RepID=A0ACB7TFH6_HYAAI|nr:hypothetical protein HPB50_005584 [Hyalomma asiaticum]
MAFFRTLLLPPKAGDRAGKASVTPFLSAGLVIALGAARLILAARGGRQCAHAGAAQARRGDPRRHSPLLWFSFFQCPSSQWHPHTSSADSQTCATSVLREPKTGRRILLFVEGSILSGGKKGERRACRLFSSPLPLSVDFWARRYSALFHCRLLGRAILSSGCCHQGSAAAV